MVKDSTVETFSIISHYVLALENHLKSSEVLVIWIRVWAQKLGKTTKSSSYLFLDWAQEKLEGQ